MPKKWEEENIQNDHILYVRVHVGYLNKKNNYIPNAASFYNTPKNGDDLSSDWNMHSTPEQSRERIGREYRSGKTEFKNPEDFFIVSFLVSDILEMKLEQKVKHTPRQDFYPEELPGSPWNQSHSSIIGRDEERRLKMVDLAKWEIPPPEYDSKNENRTFRH